MSRSRPIEHPVTGETIWFDVKGGLATPAQITLLSDLEGIPLDDLLDEGLCQRQVLRRIHEFGGLIPEGVLERRRERLEAQKNAAPCRWCSLTGETCEGPSTKHHFVPRWLLLLLENYSAYAARSLCCIPICLSRHADLHFRRAGNKSIVDCLNARERAFAHKLITELKEQRPAVYDLILSGDQRYAYESQLLNDYIHGKFSSASGYAMIEEEDVESWDCRSEVGPASALTG